MVPLASRQDTNGCDKASVCGELGWKWVDFLSVHLSLWCLCLFTYWARNLWTQSCPLIGPGHMWTQSQYKHHNATSSILETQLEVLIFKVTTLHLAKHSSSWIQEILRMHACYLCAATCVCRKRLKPQFTGPNGENPPCIALFSLLFSIKEHICS